MSESHFANGFRFLQEGRFADAVAAFQAVLQQQPDLAEAHYNLGNAYVGTRQYALAVASYQEAIRLNPNFVQAHTNLGFAYARLGAHGSPGRQRAGYRVRGTSVVVPDDVNWIDGVREAITVPPA
jgi:tetratricopeptide (TPR) repeat protein